MILWNIIMALFTLQTAWMLHLFKPERPTARTYFGSYSMPCSFNFMAKIEYLIQPNSSSGAKKCLEKKRQKYLIPKTIKDETQTSLQWKLKWNSKFHVFQEDSPSVLSPAYCEWGICWYQVKIIGKHVCDWPSNHSEMCKTVGILSFLPVKTHFSFLQFSRLRELVSWSLLFERQASFDRITDIWHKISKILWHGRFSQELPIFRATIYAHTLTEDWSGHFE